MNPTRIWCISLYPLLGMAEPWAAQYWVCGLLPFFVYHFSAKGKNE